MAKKQRVKQGIFAEQAGSRQITAFGTAKSDNPEYTTSVSEIQNTNYLQGWLSAILADKSPWEEDMNALFYAITTQLAYLFQEGIPEYDSETAYYIGSLVKFVDNQGKITIYKSLTDENTGNPLTNSTYWSIFFTENVVTGLAEYEIGLPQQTLSNTLMPNEIWLEGQTVSRTTYSNLFAIYGTTYGAGDGTTTFKLPDFRNRVMWGASSFGYQNATLPSVVIPNTGWSITGTNPGTVPLGTLVAGSGRDEISEKLESLSPTSGSIIAQLSGSLNPAAIKVRVKTRYY